MAHFALQHLQCYSYWLNAVNVLFNMFRIHPSKQKVSRRRRQVLGRSAPLLTRNYVKSARHA